MTGAAASQSRVDSEEDNGVGIVVGSSSSSKGSSLSGYVPRNILVTGGAGFIASHVAARLVNQYPKYRVVVLDNLEYCGSLENL
eukprot:CAMPEP_0197475688 /NCGR_PEP_ID=MMETSP1309-20131121/7125_1 /TAXON_ID=464262 /ORGANISM="Genus nov. species nov., Strain RCC998" /LENGTH=83 /DNA_ID=CAMNT_0043015797 /DNA_START=45 /DNA_END=293 /DNA_ORIENTATION=+